eukprot:214855-Rhodomonas_salina.1
MSSELLSQTKKTHTLSFWAGDKSTFDVFDKDVMKFGVTYNCNALQFSGRATYDWIIAQRAKEKGKRIRTFNVNVNHWVLKEDKQQGETDTQQKAK